jgi:hypothetical protein
MKSPVSDNTGRLLLSETAGHRPSGSIWFLLNQASADFRGK